MHMIMYNSLLFPTLLIAYVMLINMYCNGLYGIVVCERLTRTRVASERTLHFFTSVSSVDQHPRITRHVASHNNHTVS